MIPLASCKMLQTANCDDPPPEGSTATITWCSLYASMRKKASLVISMRLRAMKASTSADGKALLEPSADRPIDSRKLRTTCTVEFYPKSWEGVARTA